MRTLLYIPPPMFRQAPLFISVFAAKYCSFSIARDKGVWLEIISRAFIWEKSYSRIDIRQPICSWEDAIWAKERF